MMFFAPLTLCHPPPSPAGCCPSRRWRRSLQHVWPLCLSSARWSCRFPAGSLLGLHICFSLDPPRRPPPLALSVTAAASLPGFWIIRLELKFSFCGRLAERPWIGLFTLLSLSCFICKMGMITPILNNGSLDKGGLAHSTCSTNWLLVSLSIPQALVYTLPP